MSIQTKALQDKKEYESAKTDGEKYNFGGGGRIGKYYVVRPGGFDYYGRIKREDHNGLDAFAIDGRLPARMEGLFEDHHTFFTIVAHFYFR